MTAPTAPIGPPQGGDSLGAGDVIYWDGTSWRVGPVTASDIADGSVTTAKLANLAVTDAKVATANKDGAAGTPSMRTLGTTSTTAAAGNDPRFTGIKSRTTAAASGAGADIVAGDLGGAVRYTGAGAVAVAIPDLSGSLTAGYNQVVVLVPKGAATAVTVTPAAGTINGAASLALAVGPGVRTLTSDDGLNWQA